LKPKRKRWLLVAVIIGALSFWVGIDLFGPHRADLRRFDPNEVAHLDAVMWRSYYNRQQRQLFFQLAELMRRQFHFPVLRSNEVAANAAKAAFVFKDGHSRADYEKALPDLEKYFRAICDISTKPFDVHRAAQLELEWWIVHREREHHADSDLARALAEAASEVYQAPADRLMEYGRFRADAMKIRDTKAFDGGVTEADWRQIESDLRVSWQSLWKAVQH
jgi:hypothetical protein